MDNDASHPRHTTIDHKHPRSRGGTWADDNLVIACLRCNMEKGDIPYEMYRWFRHMRMLGETKDDLLAAIRIVLAESGETRLEAGCHHDSPDAH